MTKPISHTQAKTMENRLRQRRLEHGLTQEELSEKAGVARQTISGVESGQYGLSLTVALRLAQALDTSVDNLFWLNPTATVPEDQLVKYIGSVKKGTKVRLAEFSKGLFAFPLSPQDFFQEANGVVKEVYTHNNAHVKTFNPELTQQNTVILAGCSPALAMLARKVNLKLKESLIFWVPLNSMQALMALRDGFVQVAGLHLFDEQSGEYNLPIIKKILHNHKHSVYSLCLGEQGLIVRKGNPKRIGSTGDLTRSNVLLINREEGSEARRILDASLRENGFAPNQVNGYSFEMNTHLDVAQAISCGAGDCGFALKVAAHYYDLEFVPYTKERYDLVFLDKDMENPGVQTILEALQSILFKNELEAHGYDTALSGKKLYA